MLRLLALLLTGVVFTASTAIAEVTVKRVTYHGWPECYRLSNGTAELIFVPQIGRIMRFGRVGGPNVLWENPALAGKARPASARAKEWVNYGGDKLWPAPQDRWTWPPDTALDGATHTVAVLPGGRIRDDSE